VGFAQHGVKVQDPVKPPPPPPQVVATRAHSES